MASKKAENEEIVEKIDETPVEGTTEANKEIVETVKEDVIAEEKTETKANKKEAKVEKAEAEAETAETTETPAENTCCGEKTEEKTESKAKFKEGQIVKVNPEVSADLNGFKLFPDYKKYSYTVEKIEGDIAYLRRLNLVLKVNLTDVIVFGPSKTNYFY